MGVFNALLEAQQFLTIWKKARVVLIIKDGKNPKLSGSYTPNSVLNTISKVWEFCYSWEIYRS